MNKSVIKIEHVSKSYGDLEVISDLSLEIESGEFVVVTGSSGCGKTTLLKMINGLLEPSEGTIYVKNEDIVNVDKIALRRRIGYAIQGSGLFPHLNVKKNMAYVLNLLGVKKEEIDLRVREISNIVSIKEELLERYPQELSGGECQRVGIARALAAKPEILLMDEPFGALDEITKRSLQDEIKAIHQSLGVTVIFVTHDISEALKLGTKIVVMNEGKIVQSGTSSELIEQPKNMFVKKLLAAHINSEMLGK